MASHAGSRKRLRTTGPEATSSGYNSPSSTEFHQTSNDAACASGACSHEQSLKTLQTDIEAMRQLVTCKICDRLLYEPYALACGHTYCYQCLRQWFENNPRKKTCPDCRVIITQQPTPSYLLREMVLIFVSRNEMLPEGETTDEHHTWQKEEADIIATDKANTDERTGGLFKGMFKRHQGVRGYGPLRDPGDNVDRCPHCHWELEGGYCGQCDVVVDEEAFSDYDDDSDETDDELDHELDEEDAAAVWGPDAEDYYDDSIPEEYIPEHRLHDRYERDLSETPSPGIRLDDREVVDLSGATDDDERAGSVETGDLEDFVVRDGEVAYAESDESPPASRQQRTRRRVTVSDDESDDDGIEGFRARRSRFVDEVAGDSEDEFEASRAHRTHELDEVDEDEDEMPSQRNKRNSRIAVRRRRVSSSSNGESSEDSDLSDDDTVHADEPHDVGTTSLSGFSPLDDHDHDSNGPTSRDFYDSEDIATGESYGNDNEGDDSRQYVEDRWDDHEDYDGDDSDGWGTRSETPRHTRRAAAVASHRLNTLGRHSDRYTGNFGNHRRSSGMLRGGRANPVSLDDDEDVGEDEPRVNRRSRPAATVTDGYIPHYSRQSRHPASIRRGVQGSRHVHNAIGSARPVAPRHPFQLDNTLANINNSRNNRNHNPMMQRFLAVSQPSSTSGDSEGIAVRERAGRRKRAVSIQSDEPLDGEAISDYD